MPHEVIMPALGMAQDSGLIVSWLKQPGDAVKAGDGLMEVETDKAVMEVEAQADGFLTRVTAAAGEHVPVGATVAVIADTPDEAAAKPDNPKAPDAPDAGEELPEGRAIIMPALGMAQDTGRIVSWCKGAGEAVAASDVLLEVETDKSVMEVEAGHDGFVAAILAKAGDDVPVGATIAIISGEKPGHVVERGLRATPPAPAKGEARTTEPPGAPADSPAPAAVPRKTLAPASGGRVLASPKARRLALERGLDLDLLVREGVAQPFHAADIDTLEQISRRQPVEEPAVPILEVKARVPMAPSQAFIAWLANDGGPAIAARDLWLRFAGAALRSVRTDPAATIVTEVLGTTGPSRRFADADRAGLSAAVEAIDDSACDLVLRDLSGSAILSASARAGSAPVLTIGQDGDRLSVTLAYRASQLDDDAAIGLVSAFCGRLGDPLTHLL
ncbi:pyruvate dehydrogenase [Zhengella mangrovi]|uniref:Pyruvate dehydrogenase n=1 Tax=Zhengella mangrovi TaxID=1982044 RepID=A0A2G1QNH6_9HYPH|nr:biotin/lipoyl-containing protein [Zhengella mangrovi]PHP67035.1 pyruvate dehydrogenase [Zhengella mangrovi]